MFHEITTVTDMLTTKSRGVGIKCWLDRDFLNLNTQNNFWRKPQLV